MTMCSLNGIWRCARQSRPVFGSPAKLWIRPRLNLRLLHLRPAHECTRYYAVNANESWNNISSSYNLTRIKTTKIFGRSQIRYLSSESSSPLKKEREPDRKGWKRVTNSSTRSASSLFTHSKIARFLHNSIPEINANKYPPMTTCIARSFSSKSPEDPDSNLDDRFRNDPEVKAWLREIQEDFSVKVTPPSSTDSSAASDTSDNSDTSSDSDSDSELPSQSDITDDPSNTRPSSTKSSPTESPRSSMVNSARLETNEDGTVQDENELDEEEEYEDFYYDYEDVEEEIPERQFPISLERGKSGVYDIEELVTLIRDENGRDICVIEVPSAYKYVDYMVIVTGRSTRHIKAMAELVQWVFKRKRAKKDPPSVKIEGELTKDWMALDLGNIAIHLFLQETREKYDLETLWTIGADFDPKLEEEVDPFALFAEQTWTDAESVPTSRESQIPNDLQKGATSLESLGGWHGSTSKL